jgi:hypothetical protein
MTAPDGADRIQRLEIDGVPVFWLPDGRRPMAALQFRVGRSDEPFPRMGVTHVVEHLAFFSLRPREFQANGFVDNIRTVFHVSGDGAEISAFLGRIIEALGALPLDRLTDELRILRTEAQRRTASIWDQLAWYRYGAVGQGSVVLPEFGLNGLDRDAVSGWSREWFTAGNAVLWVAGPIPDGLRLALPPGERKPIPPSVPLPTLELPAWSGSRIPGIALGLVVPRASAPTMGTRILTKRLEQHLRYELGRSYEVSIAYQPLDAVEGQASIFASCLEADAPKVRAAFLATLDEFLASGPTDAEMDQDRAGAERAFADPDSGYGELDRAAHGELIGYPHDTSEQLLAEMRAISPEEARAAVEAAVDGGILIGPVTPPPDGESGRSWKPYPNWSAAQVEGRRHDRSTRKYPWSPREEELIVGADGVTWLDRAGHPVTVRFADCIGVVIESDGARWIYGRDGFRVRVHVADWKDGAKAVAAIDTAVPPELVVRVASA